MSSKLGGRYQIVRVLGTGGMGQVCQAIDTDTGRSVAAKIMLASSEDNLDGLLRFQQEGAVLSTLKHPNIVEVYGTFLEEHTSCIIMELLEGQSLAQLLRAESLSLARTKKIVRQVVDALGYAHGRGIVHRDVKPDNVMIVGDDHVKVTDFGIARILRSGGTLNTATGTSIGTPLYMAPEQIEGTKVDGRADIYSLGTVMYQMVTGQPPFQGDDPLTVAFKHVHKAPQPPSEVNSDVPSNWEALILKALSKDPADRFQTAAAMGEALDALDGTQRAQTVPAISVPPLQPRGPDTVDRLLHPELTKPRFSEVPASEGASATRPADRPAAAAAPVQTPPPQPSPFRAVDPSTGVLTPGLEENPTVVRAASDPVAGGATVMRTAPQKATVVPVAAGIARPIQSKNRNLIPVLAAAAVLVIAVAAGAYLLLGRSPKTTASSGQPSPTATTVTSFALSDTGARGIAGFLSGTNVRLHWKAVAGASAYRLQVVAVAAGSAANFTSPALNRVLHTTSFPLHVDGAQFYAWRIQAKIHGVWGKYSPARRFRVARPVISAPFLSVPGDGSSYITNHIQLCWSVVSHAVNYRVLVNGRGVNVNNTCTTIAVHPGTYDWRVAARAMGARLYMGRFSRRFVFYVNRKPAPAAAPTATSAPVQNNPPAVQPTQAPVVLQPTQPAYVPPPAPQPTQPPANSTPPPVCQISCG